MIGFQGLSPCFSQGRVVMVEKFDRTKLCSSMATRKQNKGTMPARKGQGTRYSIKIRPPLSTQAHLEVALPIPWAASSAVKLTKLSLITPYDTLYKYFLPFSSICFHFSLVFFTEQKFQILIYLVFYLKSHTETQTYLDFILFTRSLMFFVFLHLCIINLNFISSVKLFFIYR